MKLFVWHRAPPLVHGHSLQKRCLSWLTSRGNKIEIIITIPSELFHFSFSRFWCARILSTKFTPNWVVRFMKTQFSGFGIAHHSYLQPPAGNSSSLSRLHLRTAKSSIRLLSRRRQVGTYIFTHSNLGFSKYCLSFPYERNVFLLFKR